MQSDEALRILLRRLSYPNRLCELQLLFGRTTDQLSRIIRVILDDLYDRFVPGLLGLDTGRVTIKVIREFAAKVTAKGSALKDCWGFVDGTCHQTMRPQEHQDLFYNGKDRVHSVKFQALTTPDGLMLHVFGGRDFFFSCQLTPTSQDLSRGDGMILRSSRNRASKSISMLPVPMKTTTNILSSLATKAV